MRRRLTLTVLAVVALAGAGFVFWQAGRGGSDTTASAAGSVAGFAERSVTAGAVTVKGQPRRVDGQGATFKVVFDTHSEELDLDVARAAGLEVDGVPWPGAVWDGDGPSGHHREGELRFPAGGTPSGTVRLTLNGLSAPVEFRWTLP